MAEVKMQYGQLECGFFSYNGKLYFAFPHGKYSFPFPVVNGKISRVSQQNIWPNEEISVIPLQEMANHGVAIKQGENPMDVRFWS